MVYKHIFLIGPMGVGKTTIGRQLADRLGYEFCDTDQLIEERSGADIPWIFDVEGEQGFRDRETSVLSSVLDLESMVVATGGGIIMREKNRNLLKNVQCVIFLNASAEQLFCRTSKDKRRPLLQVENPLKKIKELLELRLPLYREVSDFELRAESGAPRRLVNKILKTLENSQVKD